MSLALAHFALGATLTTLVVTFVLPRLGYPRLLAVCGGGWAMLPDGYWLLPVFQRELYVLHHSPVADLFWLHRQLDRLDPGDSPVVATLLLAVLVVATAVAEHRDYRRLGRLSGGDD